MATIKRWTKTDLKWLMGVLLSFAALAALTHSLAAGLAFPFEQLSRWTPAALTACLILIFCALTFLLLRGTQFLAKTKVTKQQAAQALLLLILALLVRLPLMSTAGYADDVRVYELWSWKAAAKGIHSLYQGDSRVISANPQSVVSDNHPGCLFPFKLIGHLHASLTQSDLSFPHRTSLLHRFLLRFPAALADLFLAVLLYSFVRKRADHRIGITWMAALAFNPTLLFDSALYGQTDALHTLWIIVGLLLLHEKKLAASGVALGFALLTKPQTYILAPLFAVVAWRQRPKQGLMRAGTGVLTGIALMSAPFILFGTLGTLWNYLLSIMRVHPQVSLNANNFWWLATWGEASAIADLNPVPLFAAIGIPISYRHVGLLLLAAIHIPIWQRVKTNHALFSWAALSSVVFFSFATQMHENYLYMAIPLLAFATAQDKRLRSLYGILSALFVVNMALHYPAFVQLLVPENPDIFRGPQLFWPRLLTAATITASCVWFYWLAIAKGFPGAKKG
jgi:Gpi18-like mannosyltransferase